MGNASAKELLYTVSRDNADKKDTETHVFCHPKMIDREVYDVSLDARTIHDIYAKRFAGDSAHRPFLGQRPSRGGKLEEEYRWKTASEVRREAEEFGSGLQNLNLLPAAEDYRGFRVRPLGICSKNSALAFCADIACTLYDITIVPLYETLGRDAMSFAVKQCKFTACVVSSQSCEALLRLKAEGGCEQLRALIVLDFEALKEEARAQRLLQLYSFKQVCEAGRGAVRPWAPVTPQSLWTICYTSGTSGEPKGVLITHLNVISIVAGMMEKVAIHATDRYLSYLPMAHVLERSVVIGCVYFGVEIGFFSGDPLKISEDAQRLHPTLFASVPRFYVKMFEKIHETINAKPVYAKNVYKTALAAKLDNFSKSAATQHSVYDKIIFRQVRRVLGGRVRLMLSGAAPVDKDLLEFIKVNFCCPVLEGYGQTEGCGMEFATDCHDPRTGSVGGPFLHLEYKLVDVPEMGYSTAARDEKGRPCPVGEVWVRGPCVSPGYFQDDAKTRETFAPGGWLQSGDIATITEDCKRLTLIDRKKNLFKLQQGEYIAPEKLENIYKLADPSIKEVFVYGDGLHSFLVGVVVVDPVEISKTTHIALSSGSSLTDEAKNIIKKDIMSMFDRTAKTKNLNSLEKLKNIHIETRNFTELNLLTSSLKLKRQDASKFYRDVIDQLYKEAEKK